MGSVGLDAAFTEEGTSGFAEAEPASLEGLLERMAASEFDLVAVGRALIANPDWAKKVREEQLDSILAYKKEMLGQLA